MAYKRSTLISRSGYSGIGDPYVNHDILSAYKGTSNIAIGDFTVSPTVAYVALGGLAYYFLLRKKR